MAFVEYNYEDIERIIELWKQIMDESEKSLDKLLKILLFESHVLEAELYNKSRDGPSFWIFETDDPMHLVNYRMQFAHYIDINFIPLWKVEDLLKCV